MRGRIIGAMAEAQFATGISIYGYAVLSNHYHLLASAAGQREMSSFLRYFHGSVGCAINSRDKTHGRVWARRAAVIPVSDEPEAQLARMRYILSNSVKEGLAQHPAAWTGPHVAHFFEAGIAETADNRDCAEGGAGWEAHKNAQLESGTTGRSRPLVITPLPHMASLSLGKYLNYCRYLMADVARDPLDRDGGVAALSTLADIARVPPAPASTSAVAAKPLPPSERQATEPRRSRSRMRRHVVHAHSPAIAKMMETALKDFLACYRAASTGYRNGTMGPSDFPSYCILPPRPWTGLTVEGDLPALPQSQPSR